MRASLVSGLTIILQNKKGGVRKRDGQRMCFKMLSDSVLVIKSEYANIWRDSQGITVLSEMSECVVELVLLLLVRRAVIKEQKSGNWGIWCLS